MNDVPSFTKGDDQSIEDAESQLIANWATKTKSLPNLVWRNSGTEENVVWQLNRFALRSSYDLPATDPSWQIASSTADFNQDGIANILWRNQMTGKNAIWEMNNMTLIS